MFLWKHKRLCIIESVLLFFLFLSFLFLELESQLTAAETRCDLLEKQLDYMRKMVHSAEKDRQEAVSRVTFVEPKEPEPSLDFQNNLRKISELEREHIKLTANQSLAEVGYGFYLHLLALHMSK